MIIYIYIYIIQYMFIYYLRWCCCVLHHIVQKFSQYRSMEFHGCFCFVIRKFPKNLPGTSESKLICNETIELGDNGESQAFCEGHLDALEASLRTGRWSQVCLDICSKYLNTNTYSIIFKLHIYVVNCVNKYCLYLFMFYLLFFPL